MRIGARLVAERERWRLGERRRVEPLVDPACRRAAHPGVGTDHVGPRSTTKRIGEVAGSRQSERKTRLESGDARDSPPRHQLAANAVNVAQKPPALAHWQIDHVTDHQPLRSIEARQRLFEPQIRRILNAANRMASLEPGRQRVGVA
jgi:hypothetical protein